ncbi:hypothetical protein NQ314_002672 [Rhamnusium bicolor]|uniref:Uncharacterized protein n=1 Tax=Rhamnusium bicolor TaxID=1586634 RepID=A0AAV8ZSF1_9CUCU|nr:hypothetical protein NQ314_002672 [Rhamnusium bicolor]
MESGNSYFEVDSMHATIERARKHRKIYTTEEWALLMKWLEKNLARIMYTLSHSDFYDLQTLASLIMINTKFNTKNEQVKWLKIKWLRFEKSKPFVIQYKYEVSDHIFLELNVLQARKCKKKTNKKDMI